MHVIVPVHVNNKQYPSQFCFTKVLYNALITLYTSKFQFHCGYFVACSTFYAILSMRILTVDNLLNNPVNAF